MTCEHKRLKHGYEKTYDVQWCLDCGVITHSSDGLIGPGLHKRTDWSNWINVNLEAWSCRNEAHDGKRCSHWCGGATCPASIRSVATTTQNDSISVSEVSPQKPDWDEACEAMRWLNDIEAMQGGRNGPSIKLQGSIEDLVRENKNLRQHLVYALPFVAERARKGSGHAAGIELNIRELLDLWNEQCDCQIGTCESKSFVKCRMAWEIENGIKE